MSDAISRFDAQKLVYDYCHARTVEGRQLKSPAVFTTHTGTDLAEAIGRLPAVRPVTVDQLAQIIRTVDGNHSLGAGALAERILSALEPAVAAHVNEKPKSAHDAANVLTPATKGAAHD